MTPRTAARLLPLAVLVFTAACPRGSVSDGGTAPDSGQGACAAGCAEGERCVREQCFAVRCGATPCAEGEVCEGGACVSLACAGLSCPGGSVCLRGRCFAARCGATDCGDGFVCEGARCVEASCAGVTCGEGTACRGGACEVCLPGYVPLDGGCGRLRTPGQACGSATECETGVCAGGVCCLTPCLGQCEGCDESGQCRSLARGNQGAPACFPGRCGGDRLGCVEDCLGDDDCAAGAFCDRAGPSPRCLPRFANGAACARETQCASGFCITGRCCDTACGGDCATCNGLTSDGFPTGSPPGTCAAAPLGALPRSVVACGDFLCDGIAQGCSDTCGTDRACQPNRWCGGGAVFTCANPLMGNGAPCDRGRQCTSGLCVDGVCCNSACGGECSACNVPGREGLCSGDTGPRTADGGYCSEGITCAQPCDGLCQTCAGGTCQERTDNGRGASCGNYGCEGRFDAGCPSSCVPGTSSGCAQGYFCTAGQPPRCALRQGAGTTCDAGAQCLTGACCNGLCSDVENDALNCGGCGIACDPSQGGSECQYGLCCQRCDGYTCVDLRVDPYNCGGCYYGCQASSSNACTGGTCCETCNTFDCVDFGTDRYNCGSCGASCSWDQECVGSTCCTTCGTADGGGCVDFQSDPLNCGACEQACDAGVECVSGSCCTTCGTSGCVDLYSDSQHCGACGRSCTGACVNGACQ